ncbi:endoplasmic reticulum-based factor for assembly of V-ATPase-domain-containing protein [Aspergillus bertholletiae]|uniref:Endoplasmic reticulum-based factor for assembly of V-ATPase-domain-containing protein n=1 Tax=Aspergillus bertholletiae TaxID=1226010 RepID=A0A5N7AP35_9EURO|nr:endoplasmic reticulum-based factor for assembly of V-ATPase-domain-containing protein [Aspergillus bertholletiae]
MVQLITTTRILSALEAIPTSDRKDLNLPNNPSLDSPITHDQLIRLSRYFRTEDVVPNSARTLNALLQGTKVYVPPPPPKPEPSPEYLALKARLLAAYETDTYNQMTSSSNTINGPSPIFASSTPTVSALHDEDAYSDSDTLTPGLVLNIFLSVVITGFSVYWALTSFSTPELLTEAVSSIWGQSQSQSQGSRRGGGVSEAVKVLVSFGAAVAVGVAEVTIYAIYLGKVERARKKERGLKERKVVVGREVLGGEDESESVQRVDGEKEEIWGRGPNGGLRRRVRERWEEKGKDGDAD